jgi:hypothetical protein
MELKEFISKAIADVVQIVVLCEVADDAPQLCRFCRCLVPQNSRSRVLHPHWRSKGRTA